MRFLTFILISLILSIPLAINGSFADTAIYQGYYNLIYDNGLLAGIDNLYQVSGKYEIGLLIIFFIEKYLFIVKLNDFYFLMINITVINAFIYWTYTSFTRNCSRQNIIFVSVVIISSYFIFSNTLYAWRNIISLCFIVVAYNTIDNNKNKFLLLLISCLFHYSALLFILLLSIFRLVRFNRVKIYIIMVSFSLFLYLLVMKTPVIYYLTAGGNSALYHDASTSGLIFNRLAITVFCIILTLIIPIDKKDRLFIILCQFLLVLAMLFFDKWFLSWRISLPAMIILIPLTLKSLVISNKNRFSIIFMLLISIIPTIRIFILLATQTGGFK